MGKDTPEYEKMTKEELVERKPKTLSEISDMMDKEEIVYESTLRPKDDDVEPTATPNLSRVTVKINIPGSKELVYLFDRADKIRVETVKERLIVFAETYVEGKTNLVVILDCPAQYAVIEDELLEHYNKL